MRRPYKIQDVIGRWALTPAAWWQFWLPQSGIRGGLILALVVWFFLYVMPREIFIDIPEGMNGEIKVSAKGFQGRTCRDFTKGFIEALGGEVISDQDTREGVRQQQQVQQSSS